MDRRVARAARAWLTDPLAITALGLCARRLEHPDDRFVELVGVLQEWQSEIEGAQVSEADALAALSDKARGLCEAAFARLDIKKDGLLDEEELFQATEAREDRRERD